MILAHTKGDQAQNGKMVGSSKPVILLRSQIAISAIALCALSQLPILGQASIPGAPDFNSVGNQTQTPVPGAGHDYQNFLGETVNMSTGSVSFKISFPVPKTRGITIPYAWTYNSSGTNQLSMVNGDQPTWDSTTPQPGVYGAWKDEGTPSASVAIWSYNPPNNGGVTFAGCNVQSGMTFTGLDGVMHNLYVQATGTQDTSTDYQQECGTQNYVPPNGDGQVVGIPDPGTAVKYLGNTKSPQTGGFIVMDKSGTIYYFGGGLVPQNGGSPPQWQGIEDRNGNLPAGPSVTGTQTQFTIGDQTYTATYTNVTADFTIQQTNMIGSSSKVLCNAVPTTVTGSMQELSSLTLPNHKSYTFHYDNVFGLLSEIDYPDGGWIKYGWQVSPSGENEYANFAGSEQLSCSQDGCVYAPVSNRCAAMYQTPVLTSRTVSFDGSSTAQSQTFAYNTTWDNPQSDGTINGWSQKTAIVTTTDNKTSLTTTTKYTYVPYLVPPQPSQSGGAGPAIPLESEIDYSDWGKSTVLKKVQKTWADQFDMTSEITTIYPAGVQGGEQAGTIYKYGSANVDANNNPVATAASSLQYLLERDDYDYSTTAVSSRTPTKKTIYGYWCCDPFPSNFDGGEFETYSDAGVPTNVPSPLTMPPHLSRAMVEDGNNNVLAAYVYQYDQAAVVPVTAIQHDDSNFSPKTAARENLTSITRCSSPSSTCTSGPTVTYTYDDTGQPYSVTDARGYTSTFSFMDNPTQSGGNTNAYLTSVTNPLGQTRTFTYNYQTGYVTSATGWNNQNPTYYCYNDVLDRVSEVDYPDGGLTVNSYSDPGNSVTTYQHLGGNRWLSPPCQAPPCSGPCKTVESDRDGMFHTIHTHVLSDPDGEDTVDTTYDGEGRVLTVTNPYRTPPYGITTNSFDALGRKIQVQEQDGNVLQWCYDGVSSTLPNGSGVSYCSSSQLGTNGAGTWVDSTDENGNHWERGSNYFGDLLDVMEPNGTTKTPSMETDYNYDLLNNLLKVNQNGKSGDTARTRTFVYDGLSRLQSSSNPETGTITYAYDLNNNLISKTDARGISITYSYDKINRLLGKTYSDGTLASCFQYDNASNGAGFLFREWTQAGSTCPASPPASPGYQSLRQIGAYDAMGRVVSEQQCVLGFCTSTNPPPAPTANCQSLPTANGLAYCYDLAGNPLAYSNGLTSDAYPRQYMLFSQGFDDVSRLSSVTNDTWNTGTFPGALFTADQSNGYWPFNALELWTMGNDNLSVSKGYDIRMRITGETAIQK